MYTPHSLSLIVPCYNEEKTLALLVSTVFELENYNVKLELIIVDDCSKDNSLEVAYSLQKKYPQIKIIQHTQNMGKGAALRTGFANATGDFVGVQDADLEYNPIEYLKLLQPLVEDKADVVYGSRYLKLDARRVLYYWHTKMNKLLTTLSNMFTNLDITDMETCYKLFRRDVIQKILPKLKENRFGFEPEITARVAEGKYRLYECAIQYNPRSVEEGKKINWKDGVRALYCVFHYSAHSAPVPIQLLIYFFVGAVSAVANLVCFSVFLHFAFPLLFSTVFSFVFSAVVNYILCIRILFKHKARWNTFGEIASYILTLVIMGSVDYFCTMSFAALGLSLMVSKAWAAVIGFFGNYALRRLLVFGNKK